MGQPRQNSLGFVEQEIEMYLGCGFRGMVINDSRTILERNLDLMSGNAGAMRQAKLAARKLPQPTSSGTALKPSRLGFPDASLGYLPCSISGIRLLVNYY